MLENIASKKTIPKTPTQGSQLSPLKLLVIAILESKSFGSII